MAEPTIEPTPRKMRRARERGEAAQSPFATAVLVLAGVSAALALTGGAMIAAWQRLVVTLWSPFADPTHAIAIAAEATARALAWPLGAAVVLGALGSFLQVGPLFSMRAMAPDASRLSPARLFSSAHLVPRFAAIVPALAIFAIAAWVLRASLPGLLGRTDLDAAGALSASVTVLGALTWRTIAVLAIAGVIAIVYSRVRFRRAQRMTHRELEEERRETEGEPRARRRRAHLHRERAMALPLEEALSGAALVVCGPAIAVILKWRPGSDEPATVSLAAHGALAARAIVLARRTGVPVAHDEALGRELERTIDGAILPRSALVRLARHLARAR